MVLCFDLFDMKKKSLSSQLIIIFLSHNSVYDCDWEEPTVDSRMQQPLSSISDKLTFYLYILVCVQRALLFNKLKSYNNFQNS